MTDDTQNPSATAEDLIIQAVKHVARILTRRLLLVIGMLLDFVLFIWACIKPDVMHLAAAIAFGLMALLYVAFPNLEK